MWHLVITEEMRELGLSGNELMVYALINGYSQDEQGCYYGSITYICNICNISRRTVINILTTLVERGLVVKRETLRNGVKYREYTIVHGGVQKLHGGVQKLHGGSAKIAPNNKIDNNIYNKSLSITRTRERFTRPTVEEVAAYCRERGNGIDAEQFCAFYESKGWVVGNAPMKDWRAAVRTWEKRREKEVAPRKREEKRLSVFEHNLKVMDKMFGTNLHGQVYEQKEAGYDEQ